MRKNLFTFVIFVIFSIWITKMDLMECKIYAQELEGKTVRPIFGVDVVSLDLSNEQIAKWQDLDSLFQEEISDLVRNIALEKSKLTILWEADVLDSEKIIAKTREIISISNQILERAVIYRIKAFEILTPEQRKRASEKSEKGEFLPFSK